MRRAGLLTLLCALTAAPAVVAAEQPRPETGFEVLAYHDVRDRVRDDFDRDQYVISTRNLIDHLSWLETNGYVPVSIDEILAARDGGPALPDKAVLLTFDDGFKSVHTHVLPILEAFGFPAVVSIVTDWIDNDVEVEQGGRTLTREHFMSWDEVRELADSGLVEIASHTHDLHRGILGNPQDNEQPAAVTRRYLGDAAYESEADYLARIDRDLAASAERIRAHTGRAPRVVTWPYGEYNEQLLEAAARHGMTMSLTLGEGSNSVDDLRAVNRHLLQANPRVEELGAMLLYPRRPPIMRAAQVDLDYVYDENPTQQEQNLSALLDRIKALEISHVFLQAFADPDADGGAAALYFPNRHLPMRADLFNRVAWQLQTRANVQVYAWLPLLSFVGEAFDPGWRVMQNRDGAIGVDEQSEPRLSPFVPEARKRIIDIYRDLAAHANFDGLLFHDDGRLSDLEDANPAALDAYRRALGGDFSIERARRDTALEQRWAELKTHRLIELSAELEAAVRDLRPEIRTARNLFAPALLDPAAERYLAQDYGAFLSAYDHVALMAMPYLEDAREPRRFYEKLARAAESRPDGLDKTIFELQTVDWRDDSRVAAEELARTMRWLQSRGVKHLGYYPDDFIGAHPELGELRRGISLARYPGGAQ